MASFDYFKQYVSEMERIKAETAHDEHIIEFRAMCAKMIGDAIPDIKEQCLEECRKELKIEERQEEKKEVNVKLNFSDIERQVREAFRRVFR